MDIDNIDKNLFNEVSPSTDNNGVLNNKYDIHDAAMLEEVERKWTTYRLARLYLDPGKQTFDINHYLYIHKYLFGKIYPFAGKIRSEITAKRFMFCLPQYIYSSLLTFFKDAKVRADSVYDRNSLVQFAVYLHTELDLIHAFREGNGRTNREFIRQYIDMVCKKKGLEPYYLDYSLIDNRETYINAVVNADIGKVDDLTILFDQIMVVKDVKKDYKK